MNVSIIIAVCYYIVLIAQFGIMWKAKNPGENEIFSSSNQALIKL